MKVLVTGGNGFIGKYVIRELCKRGIDVIAYDIVQPCKRLSGVEYITGTIMDKHTLRTHMKRCDGVFHLAAVLGVKRADRDLLKCLDINTQGTVNVLESAVTSNVPHVILSSSSEVFGDISNNKLKEDSPFNPKSGYAVSKLAGEHYIYGFHKDFGLNYNIARFFNIYGPGQVAEFIVPKFIKMASKGIPPTVYGKGDQVRSYCHIKDASRALVDIFVTKNLINETFNIGNDYEPITVSDLAIKILSKINAKLKPEFIPFSESDRKIEREIFYRVPDISKLRNAIRYEPEIMLNEGLDDVIQSGDIPDSWLDPFSKAA